MASEQEGHESARGFWEIFKSVLTNERGEAGTEEGGSEVDDGGEWSAEGELAEADQIKEPADQVKPLPVTEPKEEVEEQEEEPEESEPEVETEAEEEVEEEELEENQEVVTMRAELERLKEMNTFYQSKYNELTNRQPKPEQKPAQQQATPEEFDEPPASWENTNDVVSFFDKRSQTQTQRAMEQGFKEHVQPMFERFNAALSEVVNRAIKPNLKDFDSVVKDVHNQLFVMDETGKNAIAIKDQAMLDYFTAQKVPELAMYDWGLSQKAPQKIKEGTEKAQKTLITKLTKKPKAPKQIKNASQEGEKETGELDWDTPDSQAEKIMDKKRLI